jgi:hypothetical protein
MSHEISNIDKQQGIKQAWHGLTEVLPFINLLDSWLNKWDIVKIPMLEVVADGQTVVSDFSRLVCSDDHRIRIGKPVNNESYGVVTNAEFLEIVRSSLDAIDGVTVESVGSVCERSRIFVGVKVAAVAELTAAGRKFEPYLNFLSSHDQSAPFLANASTICPVCNNTFTMNLQETGNSVFRAAISHKKNVHKRLANIPAMVDSYIGTTARFKAILDTLEAKPIGKNDAERFFTGLLTVKDESEGRKLIANRPAKADLELSTRRTNQIERLTSLFVRGAGNKGKDRSDVFQAATDYYSHESSGGRDYAMKQVASSEHGSGATAKSRVYDVLQSDAATQLLIDVGGMVLAAN